MALNFLTGLDVKGNINLNKNELQNAVIQNLGTAPTSPVEGQIYYDSTVGDKKLYFYNGTAWLGLPDTSGSNDFLTGLSFATGTGILTATIPNQSDVTVDLDGRYALTSAIPTVGDGTLTVQGTGALGGTGTFTANQSAAGTISITHDTFGTAGTYAYPSQVITNNTGHVTSITAGSAPATPSDATITLTAGDILDGGGAFTLNQSASETITFDLATGGAGAAAYGSTSDSIKIDQITLDAYGRVTAVSTGATGQVNSIGSGSSTTISIGGTAIVPTVSAVTAAVANAGTALATGDQIYDFVTGEIANIPSGLSFEGSWNASTDTPSLAGTTPANGVFYIVSVAGSTSLSGITDWEVGDWAVYVSNGAGTDAWQKIDNTSTLSGSGSSGQLTYWTGTANVAGDAGLTYNAATDALTVVGAITAGGVITAPGGDSGEWNTGYDNSITALSVAGTTTKTLTATQQDGGTLTASWTDNDSGGTVTSIATTGPITGGTITSSGTIGITTASAGTIGAGAVAAGTGISVAYASGIATVTNTQTNSANTYAATITDSVSGTTFNHGLGDDVIVQLYDVTSKDTVYADVVRNGNYLTITFSQTPANSIRVLVQKIG